MRAQLLRATSVHVLVALLGATAGWSASAQEAPARFGAPDAGALAVQQRLAPPDLPLTDIDVLTRQDVTGSIAPNTAAERDFTGPKALTFDAPTAEDILASVPPSPETSPADAVAPAIKDEANTPPPRSIPDATAVTADPATSATVATPAPAPPVAAAPASSDTTAAAAAIAQGPSGLDAAAMTAALAGFADEKVASDTGAQAVERHKIRDAIAAFYAAHAAAPLWIANDHLTPAARAVLARLDHAAEDGLDLHRFAVPIPRDTDVATLAHAELALSEGVVAYARQASGSRVDVVRLGGIIDFRPDVAAVDRVLATVPVAADAGEALQAFNPPQPGYAALRQKLAELRQSDVPEAQTRIPAGPVLKPGMSDARVPLIRARFGLDVASVEPGVPPLVYDTRVAAAVADFQRAHGLPASGLLTPRTIAALSGGNPVALENTIMANMELWRWLPRDLGSDRIEVNIPEYQARVIRDGAVMHQTRVVVGQPDKPTPVFAQQMKFIIVNPYWNVPLSIIKNEMMPKLASDPDYFANHGYEVVERNGTTYVRQPPGDGNALGRIKFMFPNDHSVYLHDTNARSFFGRDKRALSHGCVRVDQPFSFAEAVMGRENGWSEARIRKLIGGQERTINLPKPLPIFITYFTAFVDPQTGFQLRDDVYGYAGKVKAALGLQG